MSAYSNLENIRRQEMPVEMIGAEAAISWEPGIILDET